MVTVETKDASQDQVLQLVKISEKLNIKTLDRSRRTWLYDRPQRAATVPKTPKKAWPE